MSYQALYRTWRPEYFRDIVGQDRIVTTLINQITSGRIPHAYLFCGSRGTGKTTTAKVLSRAINCLNFSCWTVIGVAITSTFGCSFCNAAGFSAVTVIIGVVMFVKKQDEFILHL